MYVGTQESKVKGQLSVVIAASTTLPTDSLSSVNVMRYAYLLTAVISGVFADQDPLYKPFKPEDETLPYDVSQET